jgi:hypothetical protein
VPLARRQDWRLRGPKGRNLTQVREIRDEIQKLVVQLVQDKGWSRDDRPRSLGAA